MSASEWLGYEAKDNFSGFTGVVIAFSEYLDSSPRVSIAKQTEDEKENKPRTFDISSVSKIGEEPKFAPVVRDFPPLIQLGQQVKDRLTEFEGIAIAMATFLSGCRRVAVQPTTLFEGRLIHEELLDESRWIVQTPTPIERHNTDTGGPGDEFAEATDYSF